MGSFPGRIVLLELEIGSAQVPPRGDGETTKKLPSDFFPDETLHIAEEGGQWSSRLSTSPLGAARGVAVPSRLVATCWRPSGASSAQYFFINLEKKSSLIITAFGVA